MPSAPQSQDAALTSILEAEERQGGFLLKSLASVQAKHFVVAPGGESLEHESWLTYPLGGAQALSTRDISALASYLFETIIFSLLRYRVVT